MVQTADMRKKCDDVRKGEAFAPRMNDKCHRDTGGAKSEIAGSTTQYGNENAQNVTPVLS